jgi:hypothetical protein
MEIHQRIFGLKLFEHPTDIDRLSSFFYRENHLEIDVIKENISFTSMNDNNETFKKVPLEIQKKTKEIPISSQRETPTIKKQMPGDTLFWNIFIAAYGEIEYLQIGSKYANREWEEKNKIRTFFKNLKNLQTTNQKITLAATKEMMSEYMTGTKTTLLGVIGLSVYYQMPIILVDKEKRTKLSFLPQESSRDPCILLKIHGKGKIPDHYEPGEMNDTENTFSLENYARPLRAITTYKRQELDDIVKHCELSLYDKSKDEIYRYLSEHLVWK